VPGHKIKKNVDGKLTVACHWLKTGRAESLPKVLDGLLVAFARQKGKMGWES
jgi:hypothetical protein